MKILFFSDNFFPETNAAASRVYERAKIWAKMGHQITIITSFPNFPEGQIFQGYKNKWYQVRMLDNLRVVRVKTFISPNKGVFLRTIDFISFMITGTVAGIFQEKPDIVLASSPQFFTAITGYLVSLVKRCPLGLEIADLWPASIKAVDAIKSHRSLYLLEKIELFLYRKTKFIVTLTESFKTNIVRRGIKPEKIFTVINGVDTGFFGKINKKNHKLETDLKLKDKCVIGYIGTMGMSHGLDQVIEVAKILKNEKNDSIHFLFVGGGAKREKLIDLSGKFSLSNVTFVNRQAKDRIIDYWSLCDLALVHLKNHPTFSEVIPSKIFEAMALGLPIIYCGPQSDGSDIVTREKVGVHIESSSPELLKRAIEDLSRNRSLMKAFSDKTGEAVLRYTRTQQANDFMKVIQQTIYGKV